jgi:lipopolysaccharide export system protein LptA
MKRITLLLLLTALPLAAQDAPVPPPTTITSEQLDMRTTDTESTFLFTGLVTVTGNEISLTCDELEVIALRSDQDVNAAIGELGQFKSLIAKGRVKIIQGDRVATCGRAEVLPGEEKIILTENPLVRDRESAVTGERMILFRGERRAVVESGASGPARVTLPPIRDLGFEKKEGEAKKEDEPKP